MIRGPNRKVTRVEPISNVERGGPTTRQLLYVILITNRLIHSIRLIQPLLIYVPFVLDTLLLLG